GRSEPILDASFPFQEPDSGYDRPRARRRGALRATALLIGLILMTAGCQVQSNSSNQPRSESSPAPQGQASPQPQGQPSAAKQWSAPPAMRIDPSKNYDATISTNMG